MSQLFLMDSFALAFRSYYAFANNPLRNSKGELTSVAYGYGNNLFRLLADKKPSHFAICKDLSGPNFRHELYDQYKANRSEMPEDMRGQLAMLDELLEVLGLPVLSQPGYEADDVLASCAKQFQDQAEIWLCTKDKDLMQLINDRVFMLTSDKKEEFIYDAAAVEAKWGVPPHQIRDLLALMGDSSDNIPGVPGVGPKTAAGLLLEHGSFDNLFANLELVAKKGLREKLSTHKEQALLSHKLVGLEMDLPLPSLEDLSYKGFDFAAFEAYAEKYELRSLMRVARQAHGASAAVHVGAVPTTPEIVDAPAEYILCDTLEVWNTLVAEVEQASLIAVDTETTDLNPRQAQLVGLCLATQGGKGYYVPVGHVVGQNLPLELVRSTWAKWACDPTKTFILHNAKYDFGVFASNAWALPLQHHDTMIASYLLNPGAREHSLDAQAAKRLGHTMIPIESLIGKGKNQILFSQVDPVTAAQYGAEDAVYTWRLWQVLGPELEQADLMTLYTEQEKPLSSVLLDMETRGIRLDKAALQILGDEIRTRLAQVEEAIHFHAGGPFSVSSPKQLGEVLFEVLGLSHGKKTKTGWSTDASVLENLLGEHPIVALVMEYRELEKLRGTYVETLPLQVEANDRIHTSYNQVVAATGRLSSQNPNLQNIPIRTDLGARIRSAFVAQKDHVLLSADYSQIELRVLAHLSEDPALIQAYRDGIDIHSQTAALVFGCFPEMVSPEMRRQAKAINFGVLYGMSAFRLANELGIGRKQAQDFIDGYFAAYPGVVSYLRRATDSAREKGYAETLFGLKRPLPDLSHSNANIRQGAERTALNTPIQGTAADLIKRAMLRLHTEIPQSGLRLQMLLQVHDELVFECHADDVDAARDLIHTLMTQVTPLAVPLEVEIGVGLDWRQAH